MDRLKTPYCCGYNKNKYNVTMKMKKILKLKTIIPLLVISIIGVGIISAVSLSMTVAATNTETNSMPEMSNEINKLTGEWWQWTTSIPVSVNPILDTTGVDCMLGQSGPIWFLSGTFGGSVERKCSIPADKKLFFPVINYVNVNTPNFCQGPDDLSVKVLRSQVAPFIDNATNLSVKVDNKPQRMNRVKSNVFDIAIPEDNIFNASCGAPAGIYSPAIDDGFYVMIDKLSIGPHTLKIHAESGGFKLDVKYDLNVVPVKLK